MELQKLPALFEALEGRILGGNEGAKFITAPGVLDNSDMLTIYGIAALALIFLLPKLFGR